MQVRADLLVQAAMTKLGARSPLDLARALALTGDYREKRVRRWIDGDNAPDYEGTLALLAALDVIDEQKLRDALSRAAKEAAGEAERSATRLEVERREGRERPRRGEGIG